MTSPFPTDRESMWKQAGHHDSLAAITGLGVRPTSGPTLLSVSSPPSLARPSTLASTTLPFSLSFLLCHCFVCLVCVFSCNFFYFVRWCCPTRALMGTHLSLTISILCSRVYYFVAISLSLSLSRSRVRACALSLALSLYTHLCRTLKTNTRHPQRSNTLS